MAGTSSELGLRLAEQRKRCNSTVADSDASSRPDSELALRLSRQLLKCTEGSGRNNGQSADASNAEGSELEQRLSRQRERCVDGSEGGIRQVRSASAPLDSELARRLSQQRQKCEEDTEKRTQPTKVLDPLLERRLSQQREKCEAGQSTNQKSEKSPRIDSELALRLSHRLEKCAESEKTSFAPSNHTSPQMESELARRLSRQRDKCTTAESAAEGVGTATSASPRLDPKLAARLAEQKQKCTSGESVVADVRSVSDKAPRFDPLLAKRMEEQRDKCVTGESAVDSVGSAADTTSVFEAKLSKRMSEQQKKCLTGDGVVGDIGSAADMSTRFESTLAKRMAEQQEKCLTGDGVVGDIGSAADMSTRFESTLAKRMAEQQEKCLTGDGVVGDIGSAADMSTRFESTLAKRMAEQQEKCLTGKSSVADVRSKSLAVRSFEPSLSKRMAEQQEKCLTGESAVEHIERRSVSVGVPPSRLDPKLVKRFAEQQEKCLTGESAVDTVGPVRPVADNIAGCLDPVLARRLSEQRRKSESGCGVLSEIGNVTTKPGTSAPILDPELAARLEKQLRKQEVDSDPMEQENLAPGNDPKPELADESFAAWQSESKVVPSPITASLSGKLPGESPVDPQVDSDLIEQGDLLQGNDTEPSLANACFAVLEPESNVVATPMKASLSGKLPGESPVDPQVDSDLIEQEDLLPGNDTESELGADCFAVLEPESKVVTTPIRPLLCGKLAGESPLGAQAVVKTQSCVPPIHGAALAFNVASPTSAVTRLDPAASRVSSVVRPRQPQKQQQLEHPQPAGNHTGTFMVASAATKTRVPSPQLGAGKSPSRPSMQNTGNPLVCSSARSLRSFSRDSSNGSVGVRARLTVGATTTSRSHVVGKGSLIATPAGESTGRSSALASRGPTCPRNSLRNAADPAAVVESARPKPSSVRRGGAVTPSAPSTLPLASSSRAGMVRTPTSRNGHEHADYGRRCTSPDRRPCTSRIATPIAQRHLHAASRVRTPTTGTRRPSPKRQAATVVQSGQSVVDEVSQTGSFIGSPITHPRTPRTSPGRGQAPSARVQGARHTINASPPCSFSRPARSPPRGVAAASAQKTSTCRASDFVRVSTKPLAQAAQEVCRALTVLRVTYKKMSGARILCEKPNMRFEVSLSKHESLESSCMIQFRRATGEVGLYRDACSKILAEVRL
eukprot:TRINITY_DN6570_c0_g1_i3.p1 TRINITY_DN6570_c0_g1~~TRINITY_DN6570_c0_g1_i3.p1  ORF type:complete len:1228 (-),score=183.74 TRINITY_DN6570_c0_g1_i3:119-3685(-)